MANTFNRRLNLRLAIALLLGAPFASAAIASKPGATSPGGDPGGVRGHIDIPEIRSGPNTRGPSDLFDDALNVEDEFELVRPPMISIVVPLPGNGLVDIHLIPVLFPPSSDGVWPATSLPENLPFSPILGTPTPEWTPTGTIPAPGATLLLLTAAVAAGGRRRRPDRSAN